MLLFVQTAKTFTKVAPTFTQITPVRVLYYFHLARCYIFQRNIQQQLQNLCQNNNYSSHYQCKLLKFLLKLHQNFYKLHL